MKYRVILLLIPLLVCLYCGSEYKKHNFIWEKQYDFNRNANKAQEVVTSKKGDIFVLGSERRYIVDEDGGDLKIYWILKNLSSKGKEDSKRWNKEIKISFFDDNVCLSIDRNDNIYVVGQGYGSGSENWWVKKYLHSGNEDTEHWANKIIRNDSLASLSRVDVDNKNNLYVGGNDKVEIEEVRESGDEEALWWVKKYNEDGVEDTDNWNKKNDNGNNDYIYRIAVDKKDNVYLSGGGGMTVDGKREYYSWIRKYNEYGVEDKNWNKRFGFNNDYFYRIILLIDSSNNVYAVGTFRKSSDKDHKTLWIKKFSEDGIEDKDWDKKYFCDDSFDLKSAAIDKYDNIYIAGCGYNIISAWSGYDMWIRKIGFDGKEDIEKWDKKIDGKGWSDKAKGIAIDNFNDVYVVGEGMDLIAKMSKEDEEMLGNSTLSAEEKLKIDKNSSSSDWWILKFRGDK